MADDKDDTGVSYEQKRKFCSVIAKPLADEKLCKKLLKMTKKAAKRKQIKRGVKEVVKALRKNVKGCALRQGTDGRRPPPLCQLTPVSPSCTHPCCPPRTGSAS